MNKHRAHHEVFWGLIAQGIGLASGLLALWFVADRANTLSLGLGNWVCLLPNFIFYKLFFRYQGARHANTIKNRFYVGEMVKMGLTAGMFVMVWQITWINPLWVLSGYGMSLLCFFLPPMVISFIKMLKVNRNSQAGLRIKP